VKLAGGIGCTLGFLAQAGYFHDGLFPYYVTFFVDMICVAVPYATVYGLFLGMKSPDTWREFARYLRDKRSVAVIVLSFAPSFIGFRHGVSGSCAFLYCDTCDGVYSNIP